MSDITTNDQDYVQAGRGNFRWAVKLAKPLKIGTTLSENLFKCATKPHAEKLAAEFKSHGGRVVELTPEKR